MITLFLQLIENKASDSAEEDRLGD